LKVEGRNKIPEGPEVRRCGEQLGKLLVGEQLSNIVPISGKLLMKGVPGLDLFCNGRSGQKVTSVGVKGKVIFIEIEEFSHPLSSVMLPAKVIVSTLGMSGWWYPASGQLDPEWAATKVYANSKSVTVGEVIKKAEKHARLRIITMTGKVAQYIDPRNFGNITVLSLAEAQQRLDCLGTDAFGLTYQALCNQIIADQVLGIDKPIGEWLMMQDRIAGIGNIYRAEILYLAGINPKTAISALTLVDLNWLATVIPDVMKIAYETHGTMSYSREILEQYKIPYKGYAYKGHLAYGRSFDLCGHRVVNEKLGGRSMWWVPERKRA
jgi:formamidopyrimidine-DNA glycosylase